MPNEFDNLNGPLITIQYTLSNPTGDGATNMLIGAGVSLSTGFTVPTGHYFVPLYLWVGGTDVLASGSALFQVANGAGAVPAGPEVTLTTGVGEAVSIVRPGASTRIAAGQTVRVRMTRASYTDETHDYDAVLMGVMAPV